MKPQSDIGLIGLAVMGENLSLNIASRGYTVSVFNRTTSRVSNFVEGRAAGKPIRGALSVAELVESLASPRKIMLMVKAGKPVDMVIEQLLVHLQPGDIIIDGGNSHYPDSNRRTAWLRDKGILFVGCGVSGGEEGALTGPSIMPGGAEEAWPEIKPILQSICAKLDDGTPCCDWVGQDGAGHFVKMVHNGIEYGDMQLLCEAYQFMKDSLGMQADEISEIYAAWNGAELESYLVEISRDIMAFKDEDGEPLVEKILDTAGQKGTGKWTAVNALESGIPLTLIGEAVFARFLSARKDERLEAARKISGPPAAYPGDRAEMLEDLRQAVYASKIISYTQGYLLMQEAARQFNWQLNYGGIATMWQGGCIIRSVFLARIREAFDNNPDLSNLLLDDFFRTRVEAAQSGWRRFAGAALAHGIPTPAITAALNYFDGLRTARLPANLLQAQRDYFGAHTYERIDRPRGEFFHTDWTGRGGSTSSTTYNS